MKKSFIFLLLSILYLISCSPNYPYRIEKTKLKESVKKILILPLNYTLRTIESVVPSSIKPEERNKIDAIVVSYYEKINELFVKEITKQLKPDFELVISEEKISDKYLIFKVAKIDGQPTGFTLMSLDVKKLQETIQEKNVDAVFIVSSAYYPSGQTESIYLRSYMLDKNGDIIYGPKHSYRLATIPASLNLFEFEKEIIRRTEAGVDYLTQQKKPKILPSK